MFPYFIVAATFAALGGAIFLVGVAEVRSWSTPSTTQDADRAATRPASKS